MTDAGTGELDAAAGTWLTGLAGLAGPDAAGPARRTARRH